MIGLLDGVHHAPGHLLLDDADALAAGKHGARRHRVLHRAYASDELGDTVRHLRELSLSASRGRRLHA